MPLSLALVPTDPARWLWPASLVATSWLATGPAGALVVLGTLALAVGSRRLFPSLAGPVVWAAAVLLEFGLLSLAAMALPITRDGPLSRGVALAVLIFPALVGMAAALTQSPLSRRVTSGHRSDHKAAGAAVDYSAISLAPVAVFTTAWLLSWRGNGFSTAWAMSGDARNHVIWVWEVIAHGGVTIDDLNAYPLMVNSLAAFLSTADGRGGLAPGQQLVHDAMASSDTLLLASAALAALFTCALLETLAKRSAPNVRGSRTTVIVSATLGGLLPGTALVTGTALDGGSLSAYGAAAVAMAVIVLCLRAMTRLTPVLLLLIASGGPLLLTAWPVAALLVPPLVALVAVSGFLTRPLPRYWSATVIGAGVLAAAPLAVFLVKRAEFATALVLPGTFVGPQPMFLLVLGLVSAGLLTVKEPRWSRAAVAVPLMVALAGAVVIGWLMALGPGPMATTYYASKMLWLVESLLAWVLFIPVAAFVAFAAAPTGVRWRVGAATVVWSAAVLACTGLVTPLTNPVRYAWKGWNQPRAAGIAHLEQVADAGRPFVFYHWTDGRSQAADGKLNDRILNFWSAALLDRHSRDAPPRYDPALLPGGMITWAVNAYGQVEQLCVLARAVPELVVVTRDRSLRGELGKACEGAHPTFRVDAGT